MYLINIMVNIEYSHQADKDHKADKQSTQSGLSAQRHRYMSLSRVYTPFLQTSLESL